MTPDWQSALVGLAKATEELVQRVALQKPSTPWYIALGAATGFISLLLHIYQHFTRCPDFRFRHHRVEWFTAGGPGYPIGCEGTWIGVQGQVYNKGHRAGSLLACRVESEPVGPLDGQGCYPGSFLFPHYITEGGSLSFDAMFHLSKTSVQSCARLPCVLIIERDRGRPQRYALEAEKGTAPSSAFFQTRIRSRRALWATEVIT